MVNIIHQTSGKTRQINYTKMSFFAIRYFLEHTLPVTFPRNNSIIVLASRIGQTARSRAKNLAKADVDGAGQI